MITTWQVIQLMGWILVTGLIVLAGYKVVETYDPGGVHRGIWWGKKWVRIVTAFVVINWDLLLFAPTSAWWIEVNWMYPIRLTFFYLAIGLGASLMPDSPKLERRFGFSLITLSVVCVLFYLGGFKPFELVTSQQYSKHISNDDAPLDVVVYRLYLKYFGKDDVELAGPASTSTTASANLSGNPSDHYSLHITDDNREVAEKVIAAVRNSLQSANEQEIAIQIAYLESGFRQNEPDGKTALKGVENPEDRCAWQINEDNWLAKSTELGPEYNFIQSLDGCNKMAMWIWKEKGANEWVTANTARQIIAGMRTQETNQVAKADDGQGDAVRPAETQGSPATQGQFYITRMERVELPDEPEILSIDLPIGGVPTRQIKCKSAECSFVATGVTKYSINGGFYNIAVAGGKYNIGAGQVRFLDGRNLFPYERDQAPTETVTIYQDGMVR